MIKAVSAFISRYIDVKIGLLGASMMGIVVFIINYFPTSLLLLSLVAALKQAFYTFFMGGAVFRATEYLATHINNKFFAILAGAFIPFVATCFLVFVLHSFKGTPRPIESTIPTLFVITGTLYWAIKKRNAMEKNQGKNS